MAELAIRLHAICEHEKDYQQLLHDSSHECRQAALALRWSEIEQKLEEQGFQRILTRDTDYFTEYEYLAVPDAWTSATGAKHFLYLALAVGRGDNEPGKVITADAGLRIEPKSAYPPGINADYPAGTILRQALRSAEFTSAVAEYPFLEAIDVRYGYVHDRWADSVYQGFHVSLTLTDSSRDWRGARTCFTAVSGLDPPIGWDGKPISQSFKPQNSITAFRCTGDGRWQRD